MLATPKGMGKVKRSRRKKFKNLSSLDKVKFYLSCDYDTERNCDEHGCDSICRCSRISNISIQEDELTSARVSESIQCHLDLDEINTYCVERILNIEKISNDDFYIDVYPSYYGDEYDVYIDNKDLKNKIQEVIELKDISDKIRYILNLEYDFLPPDIKNAVFIDTDVEIKDIIIPKNKIKKKVDTKKESSIFCGIFKNKNGKFEIIDGNHRVAVALSDSKIKKVRGLVYS